MPSGTVSRSKIIGKSATKQGKLAIGPISAAVLTLCRFYFEKFSADTIVELYRSSPSAPSVSGTCAES